MNPSWRINSAFLLVFMRYEPFMAHGSVYPLVFVRHEPFKAHG